MTPFLAIAHIEPPLDPSTTRSPLVLVVDDDAGMRAYIRECLAFLPVRVAEAGGGSEAMEQLQGRTDIDVALIICDIVMPGMDGSALKAALRADPRWEHVPVLLITGEAVRSRDGPVLRKPFNARKLLAAVVPLLESS